MNRGRMFAAMAIVCACTLFATMAEGEQLNALAAAAAAALKSGDAENADNLATQALAIGALAPVDRARVLLNRGLARERLDRRDEALIDFSSALDLGALPTEDKVRALFDRGVTYDEMGRTQQAVADYSAALKLAPDFAPALNNRANVYRRTGYLEDAKHDYQASLAANNTQPEFPAYGLGQISEAQNDPTAAREWYKRALTANPNYALAAQRLVALGDMPAIVLKPPAKRAAAQQFTPPPTVVADTNSDKPIVLRPPVERTRTPKAEPIAPSIAPAAYAPPDDAPDLRPAIVETIDKEPRIPSELTSSQRVSPRGQGGNQIQLGAWTAEADAANGWNSIVGRAGNLLDGLTPEIVAADIPGKGRYFRLRAAAVGTSAGDLCARLQKRGLACIAVK